MKILFDANTPAGLASYLKGHQVTRADEIGWHVLKNGALLSAAEQSAFDMLLTCDQNVPHQQNFKDRKLAVVNLSTNHWPTLRLVAAKIASAVDFVQRGQLVTVDIASLLRKNVTAG